MMIDDLETLARLALNTDPDDSLDLDTIDEMLLDELDVSFAQFCDVVMKLVGFTPVMQIATLDGREEYARGFVHDGRHIVSQVVGMSARRVESMSNDLYRR